jgi:hypothetical protein
MLRTRSLAIRPVDGVVAAASTHDATVVELIDLNLEADNARRTVFGRGSRPFDRFPCRLIDELRDVVARVAARAQARWETLGASDPAGRDLVANIVDGLNSQRQVLSSTPTPARRSSTLLRRARGRSDLSVRKPRTAGTRSNELGLCDS